MNHSFNALIIEDDYDIANLVAIQIKSLQGTSHHVTNLSDAALYSQKQSVDIYILDLTLPDGDGLDFCKTIRLTDFATPILMLTARSNEVDRVLGLELGADDYLSKPFGLAELKARIKAILRRTHQSKNKREVTQGYEIGSLKIMLKSHQAWLNNQALTLTVKEFDLLSLFAQYPNQVFSRMDLLEHVWGIEHDGYEHTVNSHMNRLRKKIESNPENPLILETVWGVGYKLNSKSLLETSSC
ncbi:MAG: response regulator transcription factor [Pseudomonadota bacterium]|nr:response regulator transcription factor [Pseudomonadota bacterium]